jgi:hypothetical protein
MFIALEGKFPSVFVYSFDKKNADDQSRADGKTDILSRIN